MATWTDGAAYAPIERPDGFATPEAAPLEVAGQQLAPTPGPIPAPQGFAPSAPQVPLEQIRTEPAAVRDPAEPFHTASATLTAGPDSHGSGQRDPLRPFSTYTTGVGSQELPPPTGAPLPPPTGAPISLGSPPPAALLTQPGPPPQPGMPSLPDQPPAWNPPGVQSGPDPRTLNTLLGLAGACMLLGVLLPGAAPWLVLIGGLLMLRTQPLSGKLGAITVTVGLGLLLGSFFDSAVFALVASLTSLGFGIAAIYYVVRPRSR